MRFNLKILYIFISIVLVSIGLTWLGNFFTFNFRFFNYIFLLLVVILLLFFKRISFVKNNYIIFVSVLLFIDFIFNVNSGDFTPFRSLLLSVFYFFIYSFVFNKSDLIVRCYIFITKVILTLSFIGFLFVIFFPFYLSEIPDFWGHEFISRFNNEFTEYVRSEDEIKSLFSILSFGYYERNFILNFDFIPLGISYEPHVNMLFLAPGLLLNSINRNFWLIFLGIYSIIVTSLTSFIAIVLVYFVSILFFKQSLSKIYFFTLLLLSFFLTVSFLLIEFESIDLFDKLIVDNRSRETTFFYWNYIMFFQGNYDKSFLEIPVYIEGLSKYTPIFLLGTLFYFSQYIKGILSLFKSYKLNNIYLFSSVLYVIIHSIKLPLHMINYPLWLFLLVLSDTPSSSLNKDNI